MNYGFMRRIDTKRFIDKERQEDRLYPLVAFPFSNEITTIDRACAFSKAWWPESLIYSKKGKQFLVVQVCTKPRWFRAFYRDIRKAGGRIVFQKPTFVDKLIAQMEKEVWKNAKGRK